MDESDFKWNAYLEHDPPTDLKVGDRVLIQDGVYCPCCETPPSGIVTITRFVLDLRGPDLTKDGRKHMTSMRIDWVGSTPITNLADAIDFGVQAKATSIMFIDKEEDEHYIGDLDSRGHLV